MENELKSLMESLVEDSDLDTMGVLRASVRHLATVSATLAKTLVKIGVDLPKFELNRFISYMKSAADYLDAGMESMEWSTDPKFFKPAFHVGRLPKSLAYKEDLLDVLTDIQRVIHREKQHSDVASDPQTKHEFEQAWSNIEQAKRIVKDAASKAPARPERPPELE